ncbi:hypothetical protein HMPREF0758_5102 [Serratia odorifera DSM 4582]|uniref:Uncharacterized protein n=2 Tax=Serratia odorifera TaxID=618 RepID=D4EAA2_SEROD|nr:hypothetical protein HMPREF0758_5102 [Serratia odorifera DSM 4582]
MTMKEIVNITHISRGSILKWHINILYQESPYRFGLKKQLQLMKVMWSV